MAWGINSVALKSPWCGSPSLEALLEDQEHMVSLDRFYRDGGRAAPATPTEFRLGYNSGSILAVFRCTESNPLFPAVPRTADEWYPLINSSNYPDTLFPDQVDLLIQPDMGSPSYYQFAMTPDGKKLGCSRMAGPDWKPGTPTCAQRVDEFNGLVARSACEWSVRLEIPWTAIGGKPSSHFGVLPIRTRWRDGEVSSPVAFDFMDEVNSTMKSGLMESPAVDLFIETHFAPCAAGRAEAELLRLASGVLRWQRPAVLEHPDVQTRRRIWQLQCSLSTPTDEGSLADRIQLTQRWTDMMVLEGFTFLPGAWKAGIENLSPYLIRRQINGELRRGNVKQACALLDGYLAKLDRMSRWWYADESPGNIRDEEWVPIARAESLVVRGKVLSMSCVAGDRRVELCLVLPATGGFRIFGEAEGHWRPARLLPLKVLVTQSADSLSVESTNASVVVQREPFSLTFHDSAGKAMTGFGAGALALRFGAEGKIVAVDVRSPLQPDEVIYGFGERYDGFDHNGKVITLWGTDDWIGNGIGLRNTTYKPLPLFHSTRGYTVFVNSTYRLRGDVGRTDPTTCRLTVHGPILDLYVWTGTPEQALESYTALTGRPPLPPRWAFEPWMGRGGEAWANGPLRDAVAEEKSTLARFAELDIPHSAIYAEGPSANSSELQESAAARGVGVLTYFMPAMGAARVASLMPGRKREQLPILRCQNDTDTEQLGYIDFSHPDARELCRRALAPGLDLGLVGSMVDYGDLVPDGAVFHDGRQGDEMHNAYSSLYHRTIAEAWRERRGDDFILFARAAAPGTQAWVGQFAGDHPANFAGIRAVVNGALNLCACGFSTWGSDIGGYFGLPEPVVFARWTQLGCFSPLMRCHGKTPRDPWHFGEEAVACYAYYAWLRENLLDYICEAALIAHETGIPIIRPMPLAFPGEPSVASAGDQYMFGNDLLVAPVMSEDGCRTVAFPSGSWTGFWEGEPVRGPANLSMTVPLMRIPVYLREAAVVPVQLDTGLQFGRSLRRGHVRALVVTPPGETESVTSLKACGDSVNVTVRCTDKGWAWKLRGLHETSHLLVFGVKDARRVTVDRRVLARKAPSDSGELGPGWRSDGNRLAICLPALESRGSTRTIQVDRLN